MLDDKQKIVILGVLGVLVLGIGAFQLMPQGPAVPEGPKKSGWKPPVEREETKLEAPKNPTVVASLARRDPFDVPDYAKPKVPGTNDVAPPVEKVEKPSSSFRPDRRGRRSPKGMLGRLRPGSNPFDDEGTSALPDPDELKVEPARPVVDKNSTPTVAPVEPPKPPEPTFDYTLSGVIVGRRSAAVLRDKQGNQRLVTAGGMIDGEATLIEVRQGSAIVDVRGKRMRIEVKGDTDAK